MKVEGLLFALLALFLFVTTAVYWFCSKEVAGTTMILLSGGLALIIGYYLLFTARRMDPRPEDRPDAEISEGSGEVGFFAPHSWWPIISAFAFAFAGTGIAVGWWMVIIGIIGILIAATGFLLEYYWGLNRSQALTVETLQAIGEPQTAPLKWLQ